MNRLKSISLEEIGSEGQWYGPSEQEKQRQQYPLQDCHQPQNRMLNRQPSLNSKWRLASKHMHGGSFRRSTMNPNSANTNHQTSQNLVNSEPSQQACVAGELKKIFDSEPKTSRKNFFHIIVWTTIIGL